MLMDTDILIWYLRGYPKAQEFIERQDDVRISAVTYMELVQGVRNQDELRALRRTLTEWNAEILPLTQAVSNRAIHFLEQHYLSHSLRLADALIAGTALENGLRVATANVKHYKVIEGLGIVRYRP